VVDEEGDRAAGHGLARVLVAVEGRATDAAEERAGRDATAVMRDALDVDVRAGGGAGGAGRRGITGPCGAALLSTAALGATFCTRSAYFMIDANSGAATFPP
jgi:hypothetical protein